MSSTLRFLAVAVGVTVLGISAQARAARTLWLDAAAPGANPGTTWEDLSPSGYDFANMGATHNAATMSYHFVGDDEDIMVGTGDESLYDFETEKAGAGLGTPFSIVLYYRDTRDFAGANAAITKRPANGLGPFVYVRNNSLDFAPTGRVDVGLGHVAIPPDVDPEDGADRVYHRIDTGPVNTDYHMVVITHDGSGTAAGTNQYLDGSSVPLAPVYNEDNLVGSILNDEQLRLGTDLLNSGVFQGEMAIVEIWNEVLPGSYSEARWNGGQPQRVPEPSTMVLAALGVIGLAGRVWQKRRQSEDNPRATRAV